MYMRYMDDFIILSPDKEELRRWLADIERFLQCQRPCVLYYFPYLCLKHVMVNALEIVVYVRFDRIQRRVRVESLPLIKPTFPPFYAQRMA